MESVICITGASQGIGRALATYFSDQGHRVFNLDVKLPADGSNSFETLLLDITDEEACGTIFDSIGKSHGRLDVLINCASIFSTLTMKPFWEIESSDWDQVINVNLKGTFNTCKKALPWLKKSSTGRIINFSSAVVPMGRPNYLHYVSSKAGVQGLSRAMAREVGDFNITVNAILPGATVTEVARETVSPEQMKAMIQSRCIKRPQEVSDLTGVVGFLCSQEADFITGQSFVVDGGLTVT
ncbi:MAG: SDR family oxidoreductase [Oceanospirillales bacterium TMED33]|nr:dehydrogenase [Gammaproteobacteria bacterium]RPG19830.1 MAG: SDR family oxidoreductase [Oceanospirillales bacterium TMED33]CAI8391068.1 MAG: 3-oxoacyl-[acyl-carrier-protein] reductase FabG [Gammaproteobacteria bacterium]